MSDPTEIPMGSCAPVAAPATADAPAPASVGRYHVLEEIGSGGMGVVYKAEQRHPIRRLVALKLVKAGYGSADVVARFEVERQALALMDHPNVARVLDAGTTPDARPYFVMEYVPGEPITRFADANLLGIRQRLLLFTQACHAIAHAHTKGIIHRDVKAGNVLAFMQDGTPTVKVIDFGIAKALAGDRLTDLTYNTQRGQLIGTYESMSPEQAEGSLDIDTRTDVYSLGALLYELLTGRPPFDRQSLARASDVEVRRIIREHEPERPSMRFTRNTTGNGNGDEAERVARLRQSRPQALARQLRSELEWIPLMAMRKQRQRRYASPLALAEDVQNYLQGRPLLAGPESAAYRVGKFVGRNRAPVVAAAVVVMLAVAGSVMYVRGLGAEQRKTEAALVEARRQEREATNQAAVAQAVSDFQSDMLSSADPQKLLGDKVTVLDVTQAAVADLDAGKLKDQPLLEAAVRHTIGNTLASLGKFDAAAGNLRRSLELRRRVLAAARQEIAAVLESLGDVLRDQGKFAEAEPLLREAVEIRRRAAPAADDALLGASLNGLGLLLKEHGRLEESESTFREALRYLRAAPPQRQADLPKALNNFASLLQARGKFAEAGQLYSESLEIKRRTLPPAHPSIANSLSNLSGLYITQGRYADAEPLAREALAIRRKSLPDGHADIAANLSDVGLVLYNQRKLSEAEPWLSDGVAMSRRALPPGHPQVAVGLINLGLLKQAQHRLAEAEPLYREALAINRTAMSAGHPLTVNAMLCLGGLLRESGRPAEAEPLFREVLEINRKAFPDGHPYIAVGMYSLAMVLREEGKLAEAEPMYRDALARYAKLYGPADGRTCRCAFMLAAALDEQSRPDEAQRIRSDYKLGDPSTPPTTVPATLPAAR